MLATGINGRGGITVTPDEFNPERIQEQFSPGSDPFGTQEVRVGDHLGGLVGVLSYRYGNYELLPTAEVLFEAGTLEAERTSLIGDERHLTVASFNVKNLAPDQPERSHALAAQIVLNLCAPDIVALQEVQDNDGVINSGTVAADLTAQQLTDAIEVLGGPAYTFLEIPPVDRQDGGAPGGNIRVAYLYDPSRVTHLPGRLERIVDSNPFDGDAFASSRKPLLAEFRFRDTSITLINNHFRSRSGSDPLFGANQPPEVGGDVQREAQAAELDLSVRALLTFRPDALLILLGDFNAFWFEAPLNRLTGEGGADKLRNTSSKLDPAERYTYLYEGNAQQLDHMLVSPRLYDHAEFDIVHVNAEFPNAASDHDPVVARFEIAAVPEPSPELLQLCALVVLGLLVVRRNSQYIYLP